LTYPFGLETKCPHKELYEWVPSYYLPQIAMQAYVCDLEKVMFSAWRGHHIRAWWVVVGVEYTMALLELLDDFLRYLDLDIEPPRLGTRPAMPPVCIYEAGDGHGIDRTGSVGAGSTAHVGGPGGGSGAL
jgi:hypothetical protein